MRTWHFNYHTLNTIRLKLALMLAVSISLQLLRLLGLNTDEMLAFIRAAVVCGHNVTQIH